MCFPNLRPYNSNKLHLISAPYTFLGYSPNQKRYKCRDPTVRIFVSCHVTFHKNEFPFKFVTCISKQTSTSPPKHSSSELIIVPTSNPNTVESPHESANLSLSCNTSPSSPHLPITSTMSPALSTNFESIKSQSSLQGSPQTQPQPPQTTNVHFMVTRSKLGVFKPKAYVTRVTSSSNVATTYVSLANVPTDVHDAMKSPQW